MTETNVGTRCAALALAAVAHLWAAHAQPIRPAPAFKGDALVAPPQGGWPTNGGNWYNQRYSPLTQIDRGNVASLKGVWRTRLRGSGVGTKYSGEAQPLVYDGVVYVVTGADDVFALGVDTGDILWSYEAKLDDANDVVCCGWTSRGVGLGDGKVFVGQLDGKLVALDQKTGAVAWSVQAERWQDGLTLTSAPLYYDGLVITGFAGAEYGIRGRVKAFDARDGKTATSGGTAADRSGRRPPSIRSSASSISRPVTPVPTTTAACAPATTCSRRRSSRSTRARANTAGTFSKSITTSGTTTARARSSCSISN
jgi:glucose dehydrogenase